GNSGFSFLPVGTPTNNTQGSSSENYQSNDADESYDLLFKPESDDIDPEVRSWWSKSDRDWFAEMLGISKDVFAKTINTDGYDQREARSMNLALWPATWGYFFESMMQPMFQEYEINLIRWFFNHFVVGRGSIPTIRIDDQPYGILPTTVYSRMNWLKGRSLPIPRGIEVPQTIQRFLPRLASMFEVIQEDWKEMGKKVDYIGKAGDSHQILLNTLGLHGGSVEFHQRYAESLAHLYNLYNLSSKKSASSKNTISQSVSIGKAEVSQKKVGAFQWIPNGPTITFSQYWKALMNTYAGKKLLESFGYEGEDPEIFEKLFVLTPNKLKGYLIDDQPLSEVNPIRAYTPAPGSNNYLRWLIDAASDSLETLRKEEGFTENKRPNALLYLMLKHAMELGFWEAGIRLYQVSELLTAEQQRIAKIEPDFIHIRNVVDNPATPPDGSLSKKPLDYPFASESKYHLLYQAQPAITNNNTLKVADYIPQVLKTHYATQYLWEQVKALHHLENVPTARLERVFVEHLDCASYRFDAWKAGLIHYQLATMRYQNEDETGEGVIPTEGLYLGAYGWLENVRSENKTLTPKNLGPDLDAIFDNSTDNPIVSDDKNGGFIHAPSPTHAVTAAVLRNGYMANANKDEADALAINLS
ncbi:MAG: hypothetical protein KDD63_20910, partial [Bacteroidetes bacterium]|nr:hypothetical protein [Bacteroidota bacterium]